MVSSGVAGQKLGIKEVDDGIWLASFVRYDLGYFDLEQKTLQPLDNPFGNRSGGAGGSGVVILSVPTAKYTGTTTGTPTVTSRPSALASQMIIAEVMKHLH
jgi:hypothetical protein